MQMLDEKPPAGALWPGIHYVLNEEWCQAQSNVCIFPDLPQTARYRHQWIMLKRERPVVPCPERTPLPKKAMTLDEKARLCSVYLRPWTLLYQHESTAVPHLRNLDVCPQACAKHETPEQVQLAHLDSAITRSHRRSWRNYIDGHIVSDHASRIIKNFLLAVLAEGRHKDDGEDEGQEKSGPEIPIAGTTVDRIHDLIQSSAQQVENDVTGKAFTGRMQTAMRSVMKMLDKVHLGRSAVQEFSETHVMALSQTARGQNSKEQSAAAQREASIELYSSDFAERYMNWRGMLRNDRKTPTPEQWRILDKVHHRCLVEYADEAGNALSNEDEPLLELVHGLPGAEKAR